MENGKEKSISPATLKRWWKPMEDEEMQEQPQSEVVEEATQEEATEADIKRLSDPLYVARYAREKYLYSKEGEIILRIEE